MLILRLGLATSFELSAVWAWIVLLLPIFLCLFLITYRKNLPWLCKYIAAHFTIIWYFLITSIFTILTIYNFDSIDYQKPTFGSIITIALLILVFLPFFKRIVAFGFEAEINALETQAKFDATEHVIHQKSTPQQYTSEQLDMLHKLNLLRSKHGDN